jgi:hypothetical protein
MKKIFLPFFLLMLGTAFSNAQVTDLPDAFTSGGTVWFVRAGASLSRVSGDGVDATLDTWRSSLKKWTFNGDFKPLWGGSLSFGFDKTFGSSSAYWGMELGAAMRGYKAEAKWESIGRIELTDSHTDYHYSKKQNQTLNAYNVKLVPINIGYKFILNDMMAIDIHVGGFASYDFAGTFDTEYEESSFSVYSGNRKLGLEANSTSKHDSSDNSQKIGDLDNYTNYDFGAIGGLGFWFGHFNIDVCYQRGFISIFDVDDKFFNDNILLRLGYAF